MELARFSKESYANIRLTYEKQYHSEGDFLAPRAPQKNLVCAWAAHGLRMENVGRCPGGSPLELLLLARIKCVVRIGFIECVKYCYTCLKVMFTFF